MYICLHACMHNWRALFQNALSAFQKMGLQCQCQFQRFFSGKELFTYVHIQIYLWRALFQNIISELEIGSATLIFGKEHVYLSVYLYFCLNGCLTAYLLLSMPPSLPLLLSVCMSVSLLLPPLHLPLFKNASHVKPITYKMDICHHLPWHLALLG